MSDPSPSSEASLQRVICVCSAKDLVTFVSAAQRIAAMLSAETYQVIVPDRELESFRRATPKPFEVVPESGFTRNSRERLLGAMAAAGVSSQFGWYIQQLIKIEAARRGKPGDVNLIWDADTVPLKELRFVDERRRIVHYRGNESPHAPYFIHIEKLLGLGRGQPFSFIAQCLAVRQEWVQEFCDDVTARSGKSWEGAIIDLIDFKSSHSFSEYETLGTYIWNRHPKQVVLSPGRWLRYGRSLIGSASDLSPNVVATYGRKYDFVAFEGWDTDSRLKRRIKLFIKALVGK